MPLLLLEEKLDAVVMNKLHLRDTRNPNLQSWKSFVQKLKSPKREVHIALVGKYNELPDAYKSIYESFIHAGAINSCKVIVHPVHAETYDNPKADIAEALEHCKGVLVAPGFGERGIEGKLAAIRYARENRIPFFGICLGMQVACVEFARNALGLASAASTEVNPHTPHPVIDLMDAQKDVSHKGGTMRLGAFPCELKKKTKAYDAYKSTLISERHRHRWEFNNNYLAQFEAAGMQASGINPDSGLVEIVELKDHPWFVGVQFHPELKSTVESPHPLFISFVKACLS